MGFYHNRKQITLQNYMDEFKDYSADIKDEIRLAVMDDTEISVYVDKCKNDSYKLGQLRLCLRECVPLEFIDWKFTGRTLYNIRQGWALGIDISPLMSYCGVSATRIESSAIETLSEYLLVGVNIASVDFAEIPVHLIPTVCKGIKKGYPMHLLQGIDNTLTEAYLTAILKALRLNIDITPFLSGKWNTDCIDKILYLRNKERILYFLSLVNENFTVAMIDSLVDLLHSGIELERLCIKDTNGYPVYNQYQMWELGEAIKEGSITEAMYNPSLSDYDMKSMRDKKKKSLSSKLNIKLSKK